MIIKCKDLLLFEPDALKIEFRTGLAYSYYILAHKNGQKFFIQGYDNEKNARDKLDALIEAVKKGEELLEI